MLDAVLDAIFPPRCAGCGRIGEPFCARCRGQVEPVRAPWCGSCGATVPRDGTCTECARDPLPLDGVRSAGLLHGPLRRAVHRLKYRGRTGAARALGELLVPPVRLLTPPLPGRMVVVPVPLHPARERERGFNQAQLLAAPLAAALGLAPSPAVLRVRATPTQVGLSRAERRANLRGAFAAAEALTGKIVLLVDDVTTTGSTLGSAAAACREAGAVAVYGVTLARES